MCKQPFLRKENIRFKTRQLFLTTTSLTLIYPGYSPFFNYLLFNYISIHNASWPHNRMTQSTILIFPISSTSLGGGCPGWTKSIEHEVEEKQQLAYCSAGASFLPWHQMESHGGTLTWPQQGSRNNHLHSNFLIQLQEQREVMILCR